MEDTILQSANTLTDVWLKVRMTFITNYFAMASLCLQNLLTHDEKPC
jgi:hypothetical protein